VETKNGDLMCREHWKLAIIKFFNQTESKKGKEPRNQVPRKVWKSEEGFGRIPRLNVTILHFKVPFGMYSIEEVSKDFHIRLHILNIRKIHNNEINIQVAFTHEEGIEKTLIP
jgi:hypothetical protein